MDKAEINRVDTEVALHSHVRDAVLRHEPTAKIRDAVCALVDAMKSRGAPPEKVVIAVKSAVLADKTVRSTPDLARMQDAEALLGQSLEWCLERFYGEES